MGITVESHDSVIRWEFPGKLHRGDPGEGDVAFE